MLKLVIGSLLEADSLHWELSAFFFRC